MAVKFCTWWEVPVFVCKCDQLVITFSSKVLMLCNTSRMYWFNSGWQHIYQIIKHKLIANVKTTTTILQVLEVGGLICCFASRDRLRHMSLKLASYIEYPSQLKSSCNGYWYLIWVGTVSYSCIRSLIIHSFVRLFVCWLAGLFVCLFVCWLVSWLVGWLIGRSVGRWVGGWVGWLVGSFVRSLVRWFVRSFVRSFGR